jgi:predicted transcriptional regulator
VTKLEERRVAVDLLERHPGWSDHRVADEVGVSHTSVSRWRWEHGLAPQVRRLAGQRRRRRLRVVSRGQLLARRLRGDA